VRPAKDKLPLDLAAHAPGAIRTCFEIARAWGLSARETRTLLGDPPESTFYKWKSGKVGAVSRDLLERVSYLLGIYKALQVLLPSPTAADGWIKRPNDAPLFNGRSALEVMLSGNVADLYLVRQYLDAQRSGWA
jgi:hypothetical protein